MFIRKCKKCGNDVQVENKCATICDCISTQSTNVWRK
jgi:hypothetical protein